MIGVLFLSARLLWGVPDFELPQEQFIVPPTWIVPVEVHRA
jgi:hypothetical protein